MGPVANDAAGNSLAKEKAEPAGGASPTFPPPARTGSSSDSNAPTELTIMNSVPIPVSASVSTGSKPSVVPVAKFSYGHCRS